MSKVITPEIIAAAESENAYQASLWGEDKYHPPGRAHDDRSLDEWILYIGEYAAAARGQTTSGNESGAKDTLRKVLTMCAHAMRKHGVQQRAGFETPVGPGTRGTFGYVITWDLPSRVVYPHVLRDFEDIRNHLYRAGAKPGTVEFSQEAGRWVAVFDRTYGARRVFIQQVMF